ncbi:hypothetical protein K488DRAFT_92598 [Vararia minispora EC-137]|uniref:Uncharacterized protein n=1 Tax=Vararia minispora EC-137 TaxID=1314806 RepID=A0ACB8Q420_9AGAM|nr:hypothetical protein K488DRAFT_92598 [Vararia minispora EC-137]
MAANTSAFPIFAQTDEYAVPTTAALPTLPPSAPHIVSWPSPAAGRVPPHVAPHVGQAPNRTHSGHNVRFAGGVSSVNDTQPTTGLMPPPAPSFAYAPLPPASYPPHPSSAAFLEPPPENASSDAVRAHLLDLQAEFRDAINRYEALLLAADDREKDTKDDAEAYRHVLFAERHRFGRE